MTIRAVCIGINKYNDSPLNGCVNDVLDMYDYLSKFTDPDNIRVLLDERATVGNIFERIKWLFEKVKSGDHLYFHFSGHGTQIRRWDWNGILNSELESCLVPYDYDWKDDDSFIFDEDIHEVGMLDDLPDGVDVTFIFDVCHSGGMRDLTSVDSPRVVRERYFSIEAKSRYLKPPVDVEVRHKNRNLKVREIGRKWLDPDYQEPHRVLAACQEDQTASDSVFGEIGRPNGAFTWALLHSLNECSDRTWLQIMEDTKDLLHDDGFAQVPILRAKPSAINTYPLR